ncbi:MAG: DNA internalization-related competence protein ComEC/Rec2 [Geobacteraceae bacterium]|nr:DNA internalization-related competence protein ComEC/Rec2 [Geobacteraceae bacterium]
MSERPLLIPLFSVIAGLAAANQWQFSCSASLLVVLLGACLMLVFFANRVLFLLVLALCFFMAGGMAMEPFLAPHFPPDSIIHCTGQEPLVVEGVIDSRPLWQETGGKIYLRAVRFFRGKTADATVGRVLLTVAEGHAELFTGDLVRFECRISRPRNFGIPGEFDYERYLAFREVYVTAYARTADQMILIRRGVAYPLQNMMDRIAADLGSRIGRLLPGNEGAVLRALLLGESRIVPREIRELFARTGVSHILAISGFHVGVVAFFLYSLLYCAARWSQFLLLRVNLRSTILVLTIPGLLFYLFLSGAAPATVRSVIMISACVGAVLLQRETDPIHSLMLAALLILACSPPALFDISFQLSFLAIWGILALTPLLMHPFRNMPAGLGRKLLLFLMVSIAATAVTLIPVADSFHQPTLTGVLANFFIIPLIGYGAVVTGFSSLPLLHVIPSVAALLLLIAGFPVYLSLKILTWLDTIPLLPVWGSNPFDLPLLVTFLAAVTFLERRVRVVCCCLVVAAFIMIRATIPAPEAGKLRLDFYSVGQGEASLITFPDGRRMLIDGGGSYRAGGFDPGERLLAPALRNRGVKRLDFMVLTHAHPDHLNGLLYLARNFPVGEFWESGIHDGNIEYLALKRVLRQKGVPVRRIHASSGPIAIGAVTIEPLAPWNTPALAGMASSGNLNTTSLVFRLRLGEFSVLFTGDIGHGTEQRLLAEPSALRCTVLKVAHHGSRTSSTERFLAAASPQCALISAGYGNRFRLPAADTLTRLRRRGIPVYRTDLVGSITVAFENGGWSVDTFRKDRHFH